VGFVALQEALRREVRRRIESGELTGMELAQKTGFTQAHISNFLNRKRGLKLRALDRMLRALGLTLYDLLDPRELARHAVLPAAGRKEEFLAVPVIRPQAALKPLIARGDTLQLLHYRRSFLERLPAAPARAARRQWTRFVVIQLDPEQASAMWPGTSGRLTLLLDRHFNSLKPLRGVARIIYAVWHRNRVWVRYVNRTPGGLLLQPRNPALPTELVSVPAGADATDLIVGRVAQLSEKL
jgi:transcriptional regulator with XRE-family HTH domain